MQIDNRVQLLMSIQRFPGTLQEYTLLKKEEGIQFAETLVPIPLQGSMQYVRDYCADGTAALEMALNLEERFGCFSVRNNDIHLLENLIEHQGCIALIHYTIHKDYATGVPIRMKSIERY